jgi:diguanylate cyclase (GGDEF)-like protein
MFTWNMKKVGGKQLEVLFCRNQDAVDAFNCTMSRSLASIGAFMCLLTSILSFLSKSSGPLGLAGLLTAAGLFLLILAALAFTPLNKHSLALIYVIESLAYIIGICLSLRGSKESTAVFIGMLCIGPVCILDRTVRSSIFMTAILVIHAVLASSLKEFDRALLDVLNTCIFALLGSIIAYTMKLLIISGFEANRQLQIEKTTDVLTGLYNRRRLNEDIKSPNASFSAVLMVDTDDFKLYNDSFGHHNGDQCLMKIGMILKHYQDFCDFYRYGGEEFVGLYKVGKARNLTQVAEALRIDIQSLKNKGFDVTASIGAALCTDNDYEKWINKADNAMYKAKELGKNKVCIL